VTSAAPSFDDLVAIGRIVRPQGRKGEIIADVLSDRPDRFPRLRRAFVGTPGGDGREVTVASTWPHKGRFVLKLEGVDSIEAAERFRGLELRIPEEELEPLPAGSFYHHQLVGLDVAVVGGRALGAVESILETGAEAKVLVVRGPEGESLIPFAEGFVSRVDLAARRIEVVSHGWVDARD
jgi:16S rRNA processing protein RimM